LAHRKERVQDNDDPQLRWVHFALAALLLALLGIFTRLRPVAFIGLSAVPVLSMPFLFGAPVMSGAAILAFLLPVSAEWLLKRSRGSRYLWPSISALAASMMGVCLAGFVLGASPGSLLLVGGMVASLPWFACASAMVLATVDRPDQQPSPATLAVTTAILSRVRARLTDIANGELGRKPIGADLLCDLEGLEKCLPRLSLDEHKACREALLTAEALLDEGSIGEAPEVCVKWLRDLQLAADLSAQFVQIPNGHAPEHRYRVARHGVALIHAYRRIVPEDRRRGCRFEPTCSNYVETALLQHGFLAGLFLSLKRALRCVPHGDSGWDPVPRRE
jgi:putative membrane protein insertion efficiency factor